MNNKEHWENVFANKKQTEVSWFQPIPQESIDNFESQNIPKSANVIDIGCGDSYFIDYLINQGYENIYALDISENALQRLKERLGANTDKVNWITSNILDFKPVVKFDYWHDRAVFHFLKEPTAILKYVSIVNEIVNKNGVMMIATFSKNGPLKCSGLDISQYDSQELNETFVEYFACIKTQSIVHSTPFETTQNFTYSLFLKDK